MLDFSSIIFLFVYLLSGLFDCIFLQADLTKLVGKLCDELQQKRAVKRELQNRIQKLKVRNLKKTINVYECDSFIDVVKFSYF